MPFTTHTRGCIWAIASKALVADLTRGHRRKPVDRSSPDFSYGVPVLMAIGGDTRGGSEGEHAQPARVSAGAVMPGLAWGQRVGYVGFGCSGWSARGGGQPQMGE